MNLPNQITIARVGLAALAFAFLELARGRDPAEEGSIRFLLGVAFALVVLAMVSDALDGWLARRLGQVTTFGRIADPVADKVLILGTYLYFAAAPALFGHLVQPWMVCVILARELFVTTLRALVEAEGHSFAAGWSGKAKMILQSVTVALVFPVGIWSSFPGILALAFVWATVIWTVVSGIDAGLRARRLLAAAPASHAGA